MTQAGAGLVEGQLAFTKCFESTDGSGYGDCDISVRSGRRVVGDVPDPHGGIVGGVYRYPWSPAIAPTKGEYDLAGTIAHELGHALGLGHNTISGSLMVGSNLELGELRQLSCDDRRALYFLYCFVDSEAGDCSDATIASWACDEPERP